MIKNISKICIVYIISYPEAIYQSIHPNIAVFHKTPKKGCELRQKGDIEKIEKWLKIFSKIFNPMYQFIPPPQFKTFT